MRAERPVSLVPEAPPSDSAADCRDHRLREPLRSAATTRKLRSMAPPLSTKRHQTTDTDAHDDVRHPLSPAAVAEAVLLEALLVRLGRRIDAFSHEARRAAEPGLRAFVHRMARRCGLVVADATTVNVGAAGPKSKTIVHNGGRR